ncbi:MAG: aminotransferase class V [Bacteroidetes bacterium]|nr:MAG: aminotransferase class V [Bacteroidota bacterium]
MQEFQFFTEKALSFDKLDPLASFRSRFIAEKEEMIYLDGNSLGRMPLETEIKMKSVISQQWAKGLISSWNDHWFDLPQKIAAKLAKILGAHPDEIFVGDSTSVNFYKLAFGALKMQQGKNNILTDNLNFPSDIYLLQGIISQSFPEHRLQIVQSKDGIAVEQEDIAHALNEKTALLTLSHVAFKSAFMYNMSEINELAHQKNTVVLWDLSHAVGSVPIRLNADGADLAVGCTYKYLNGGPGAPAFLYVRRDLQDKIVNPIWGWFGHRKPFDFSLDYLPATQSSQFAAGTPHILSLSALEPGLDIILEAGINNLWEKSRMQSDFLFEMTKQFLEPLGFSIASPIEAEHRGSHISLRHNEGWRISKAMIDPHQDTKSIIPDFRPPDVIRLGIAPLYNSFTDIYECVKRLHEIVKHEYYLSYDQTKSIVT